MSNNNNKTEEHKNKYVSYVPMSKNNNMTNMYRTILLALPALLLLLAACADDVTPPAAEPADTLVGQPVRFTATGLTVTPAGVTQTKADADFSTITVYMTDAEGNTWQADYTYNETNSTWEADGTPPVLAHLHGPVHLHRHQPRRHGPAHHPAHGVDGG